MLPPGNLSVQNEKLGSGKIAHAPQSELTQIYADRSIEFARKSAAAGKPFYLHVWPNEVHDPFVPKADLLAKYQRSSANKYKQQYYKEKLDPPGSTAGLRGRKWSLYEGGIRAPLIVRWDGHIPAGKTDRTTIACGVDFFPTCCSLAKVPLPQADFDGEDLSRAFLGKPMRRKHDLIWDYGRLQNMQRPGLENDQSPNLAIRQDDWKLLANDDGSNTELYDFRESDKEQHNVAAKHPEIAKQLSNKLLQWRKSLPVWDS